APLPPDLRRAPLTARSLPTALTPTYPQSQGLQLGRRAHTRSSSVVIHTWKTGPMAHFAHARVNLDALTGNARLLGERAGGTPLMGVVKADGYGHGMLPAARALIAGGASWLVRRSSTRGSRYAGPGSPFPYSRGSSRPVNPSATRSRQTSIWV